MISLYSAEVSTLYPLDSIRRLRRILSNEVTYTQRQAGTPISSTSASIARERCPTPYSTKPEPIWPVAVHGSYYSPSVFDLFEPGRRPLTSEGSHHNVLYTTNHNH